MTPVPCSHTT